MYDARYIRLHNNGSEGIHNTLYATKETKDA